MAGQSIATCGGYLMVEDGPRIYFLDRGTNAHAVALFVLGLITGILGINAVVMIAVRQALIGVGMLGVAGLFAGVFTLVLRVRKKRLARTWNEIAPIAYIDRQSGAAHDEAGRPVAPLTQVVFRPVFQFGSSSKALGLVSPSGTIIIARGNPFAGSIGEFMDALQARGFAVQG